ncbi:putative inactive 1-aminocyclopropane-1-carboxylate synthase-like protein 2 [Thomomys bottae]
MHTEANKREDLAKTQGECHLQPNNIRRWGRGPGPHKGPPLLTSWFWTSSLQDSSSQPAEAKTDAPLHSYWNTIRKQFEELLDMMQKAQTDIEEHITLMKTRESQGQSLNQDISFEVIKYKLQIITLLQSMINLLKSNDGYAQGDHTNSLPVASGDVTQSQREFKVTVINHFLSNRGAAILDSCDLRFQEYGAYPKDKYQKDKNPLGFINLGTKENKLCLDLMTERLSQDDKNFIEEDQLQYPEERGQLFLREELAKFLTYYCKAPSRLDPENVVILNGGCSLFSTLAMVLSDPGEAFLVPIAFYGGFTFSSHLYAKVELIPVYLESKNNSENVYVFQLNEEKLEKALIEARYKGKTIRGIVLTNPQNSLGGIDSKASLMTYLLFAHRYMLHVIIDESYMLSVFGEGIKFHSVLSLASWPDPERTHVIWDASLDFGIAGFCLGALYTQNRHVASTVGSFGCLHGVSGITQYKLGRLLQDREWITQVYLPTNQSRLRKAHKFVTSKLDTLEIPYDLCSFGVSMWINLKAYLFHPGTFQEELLLHRRFLESKLILSHGKSFMCDEPGWFCLVFAEKHLEEGMRRFLEVLAEQKQERTEMLLEDALKEEFVRPTHPSASHVLKGPKNPLPAQKAVIEQVDGTARVHVCAPKAQVQWRHLRAGGFRKRCWGVGGALGCGRCPGLWAVPWGVGGARGVGGALGCGRCLGLWAVPGGVGGALESALWALSLAGGRFLVQRRERKVLFRAKERTRIAQLPIASGLSPRRPARSAWKSRLGSREAPRSYGGTFGGERGRLFGLACGTPTPGGGTAVAGDRLDTAAPHPGPRAVPPTLTTARRPLSRGNYRLHTTTCSRPVISSLTPQDPQQ